MSLSDERDEDTPSLSVVKQRFAPSARRLSASPFDQQIERQSSETTVLVRASENAVNLAASGFSSGFGCGSFSFAQAQHSDVAVMA